MAPPNGQRLKEPTRLLFKEVYERHKPDRLVVDAMMAGMCEGLEAHRANVTVPMWLYVLSKVCGIGSYWGQLGAPIDGMRQGLGLPPITSYADGFRRRQASAFVVSVAQLKTEPAIADTLGFPVNTSALACRHPLSLSMCPAHRTASRAIGRRRCRGLWLRQTTPSTGR